MEFKKYRNENKKGIELIDSRGIESNENYNTKYFMGNFTNYFEKIRKESNSNFIYGILFICEIDTISEIDTLNYLKNISNNKITLKLLYSKGKDDNQVKKINKTIASTIGIKPYFLKTTSKKDYDKNLNSFLKDLFEELDEKKLKDIYQYYYSLDVFYHFQLIMKKNNAEQDIFTKPLEKKINPTDYIIHNLEFDLNFFLPKQNINLEGINKDIKEIYNSFISELNKDFKNITYENYCLKEYENRKFFDKFKEYFISNHLPNDIIAQGVSQTINNLILNIFLITVKQQFFKKPIELRYYPDFTNIKNIIEKNFINNKENTSYSYYLVRTIVIFIIAFVAYVIYQYYKNRKRKEKEELIELENVPDIDH